MQLLQHTYLRCLKGMNTTMRLFAPGETPIQLAKTQGFEKENNKDEPRNPTTRPLHLPNLGEMPFL
jgi:hypothetical protein